MSEHVGDTGADVEVGDLITFAYGGKPVRVVKISEERFTQSALGLQYRIIRLADDIEMALFDTAPVIVLARQWEAEAA